MRTWKRFRGWFPGDWALDLGFAVISARTRHVKKIASRLLETHNSSGKMEKVMEGEVNK